MNNYQKQKPYKHKNQATMPEVILIGIGKALWWLITLPFHKGRRAGSGISSADKQYIAAKRLEIEGMATSDNIYELRHAVIEADKLVDHLLKLKGYGGESFADRLRSTEAYLDQQSYQRLWDAHKIRNQIAHQDNHIEISTLHFAIKTLLNYTASA